LAVPGWRVGVLIAEKEVIEKLKSVAANVYGSPPLMEQYAIANAIREGIVERFSSELKRRFERRREMVKARLSKLFKIHGVGKGAFYAFPLTNLDGMELAIKLARKGL
jgi:aspartate/methionine/tyrosine aminotransferase